MEQQEKSPWKKIYTVILVVNLIYILLFYWIRETYTIS